MRCADIYSVWVESHFLNLEVHTKSIRAIHKQNDGFSDVLLAEGITRQSGEDMDLGSTAKGVTQLTDAKKLDQKYIACRITHAATASV